jgi:hypothetical protein
MQAAGCASTLLKPVPVPPDRLLAEIRRHLTRPDREASRPAEVRSESVAVEKSRAQCRQQDGF